MKQILLSSLLSIELILISSTANASDPNLKDLIDKIDRLNSTVDSLQKRLVAQEHELSVLKAKNTHYQVTSEPKVVPLVTSSVSTTTKGSYLPEIGAVADVVAMSSQSHKDSEGNDRISLRDFELILGHDIDPYSRLDATIIFSDEEEPALEEGYASFWDLPLNTKLRFGRMKSKVGRASAQHRDSLDTVDVPIVVQRYLGAEGLSKTGLEISGFSPLSSDSFAQELLFGLVEGGSGEEGYIFGDSRRIPSLYARVRNAYDLSDFTKIDLGATWLNGSADEDQAREVNAGAVDFTFTHFVTPRNKLKFQSEAFFISRGESNEVSEEVNFLDQDRPWGYYSLLDYRLSERWGIGTRWDWVQPIATEDEIIRSNESAVSAYLTFYQSEFARWRFQYQHARLIDDTDDNRLYLQGTFAIGTHKHQIQ